MPRAIALAASACLLVGVVGCETLRDLWTLQRGIAEAFEVAPTNLNRQAGGNGATLTLTFAGQADWSDDERASFARDVAAFVRDNYGDYASLSTVTVEFTDVTRTGPLTTTRGRGTYEFTTAELSAD